MHGRHTLYKVATLQAMGLLDTMAASIELTATPAPPLALKCAKWRTAGDWAAEQKRFLSKGDTLVVSQLDRLARSTRNLLNILHEVSEHGATFKSLS